MDYLGRSPPGAGGVVGDEMSFTDEDLERLEKSVLAMTPKTHMQWSIAEIKALLARLEAAEAWGNHGHCGCEPGLKTILDCPYYMAWRKAAGK